MDGRIGRKDYLLVYKRKRRENHLTYQKKSKDEKVAAGGKD